MIARLGDQTAVALWLALYGVAIFSVPKRKEHKGYGWRFLRKLPPWRFFPKVYPHFGASTDAFARWLCLYMPIGIVSWTLLPDRIDYIPGFSAVIVLCVDDILNGDDETRHRREDWVRNKIKWLMELPPQPKEVQVRS